MSCSKLAKVLSKPQLVQSLGMESSTFTETVNMVQVAGKITSGTSKVFIFSVDSHPVSLSNCECHRQRVFGSRGRPKPFWSPSFSSPPPRPRRNRYGAERLRIACGCPKLAPRSSPEVQSDNQIPEVASAEARQAPRLRAGSNILDVLQKKPSLCPR
jgi:hypothetical protein